MADQHNNAGRSDAGFGGYLLLTGLLAPIVPLLLRRRLARGKELPDRWREKLGFAGMPRPEGQLIWLHAVGLGEALALRALVELLEADRPDLNILVTTGTRHSAEAWAKNRVGRALHQFLPLDIPAARHRFLDHWKPDYVIWSEQDVWPGLVAETARRGIPQAWVNARMNAAAQARRARWTGLYRSVYSKFRFISVQDENTAQNIASFGVRTKVDGSIKSAATPLLHDPIALMELRNSLGDRRVWLVAPSHPEDEMMALAAHKTLGGKDLLVVAPRYVERGGQVAKTSRDMGFATGRRSIGDVPGRETQVYVADTLGEMGLWYMIAEAVLIGGSFSDVEGHNPWEAAALGCAVMHGPRTANFLSDYHLLDAQHAARRVETQSALVAALNDPGLVQQADVAKSIIAEKRSALKALGEVLLADLDKQGGVQDA